MADSDWLDAIKLPAESDKAPVSSGKDWLDSIDLSKAAPEAEKTGPKERYPFRSEAGKMLTDIPRQIGENFMGGVRDVAAGHKDPGFGGMAQEVAGVGKMIASPITGAVESYVGHGIAGALHGAGLLINKTGLFGNKDVTAKDTPEALYSKGREAVDTASSVIMPGRVPVPGAAPVMPPRGPLGVTLSAGQKAQDVGLIAKEQQALRAGNPRAKQFEAQQAGQVAAAKEDVLRSFDQPPPPPATGSQTTININGQQHTITNGVTQKTGEILANTPQEAADIAQRKFQAEAQAAKADVDTRFEAARGQGGAIHGGTMQQSSAAVRDRLTNGPNPVLVNEKLTPATSDMLEHLDKRTAGYDQMSLEQVDQLRRELGQYRDAAWSNNASDGRAASRAVSAFNEHINKAVNSGDFIGSPGARQAWNDAVAASAKYKGTFKSDDKVGSVVQKVLGDYKNSAAIPNDVADQLYGASGVNPNSLNVGVANRFKQVLGENSKEWGAVKQGLFQRIAGENLGPKQVADRINKFLTGDGKEMAEAMYSPAERAAMQAFADLHRQLELPKNLASHPEASTVLRPVMNFIQNKVAAAAGWLGAHAVGLGPVAETAATLAAGAAEKVASTVRQTAQLRKQLPLVTEQLAQFQKAVDAHARASSTYSAKRLSAATVSLSNALKPLGINLADALVAGRPEGSKQ
jgi:hypothetical protein